MSRLFYLLIVLPALTQTVGAGKLARLPDPRDTVALAEMVTLATQLEVCAIQTTYYVSLETLNDLSSDYLNTPYDYINYEGGTFVIRPTEGRFRPQRINLLTAFNAWDGPYMNYQASQTQTGFTPYDRGSPLDPWGNPYYFFSPLGLLRGDSGER